MRARNLPKSARLLAEYLAKNHPAIVALARAFSRSELGRFARAERIPRLEAAVLLRDLSHGVLSIEGWATTAIRFLPPQYEPYQPPIAPPSTSRRKRRTPARAKGRKS